MHSALQRAARSVTSSFQLFRTNCGTPLTSVIAFADIMSRNRDDNLTGIQLEQLDIIRRNGQCLNDLVEGMLDISRLNTDMMRLELSEF